MSILFHVILSVVSLLVVVMYEVISTMGKASSKPKSPLSLFQDFREAVAESAVCVKPELLKTFCSLE